MHVTFAATLWIAALGRVAAVRRQVAPAHQDLALDPVDPVAPKQESLGLLVKLRQPMAASAVAATAQRVAKTTGGKVTTTWNKAVYGFAMEYEDHDKLAAAKKALAADPGVQRVEPDTAIFAPPEPPRPENQMAARWRWGLDRVDKCDLPLDGPEAPFEQVNATGVRMYILDSGVWSKHEEFAGGVLLPSGVCHKKFRSGAGPLNDVDGHGTHVASIACGRTYGVAKCDSVCSLKVLSDGDDSDGDSDGGSKGSKSGLLSAIDHAIQDCQDTFPDPADRRCVGNMSLGGWHSPTLNDAVASAADAGLAFVVAAGNGRPPYNGVFDSPASAERAIAAASTAPDDRPSDFTNFGAIVDVHAPGEDIPAAAAGSTDAIIYKSGTSMSSPLVAGIAASILKEDPSADVRAVLRARAQLVGFHRGNPMLLANVVPGGCGGIPPTQSPVPTATPTVCTKSLVTVKITTDQRPGETAWRLRNLCTGETVARKEFQDYEAVEAYHEHEYCLPAAEYRFTIMDLHEDEEYSYYYNYAGNGICCEYGEGQYEVLVDGVSQFVGDGQFNATATHKFGSCGPTVSPAPTPTPTVCTRSTRTRRLKEASDVETLIVRTKEGQVRGRALRGEAARGLAAAAGGKVTGEFTVGFSIEVPRETAAAAAKFLSKDPRVAMVEEETNRKDYRSRSLEKGASDDVPYPWGLDRVDQCELPLSGSDSNFTKVDARGVRIYILDSGIYREHSEFHGMIDTDSDCHLDTTGGECPFADMDGQGTHVASTACGIKYGVAVCDELCAVRVLDDNGIVNKDWLKDGLDHVIEDCLRRFPTRGDRKCVAIVNAPIWYSSSTDRRVRRATDAGVTVIASAGNEYWNVISYTPASNLGAITVGATGIDDGVLPSSNYGALVDVYAPGVSILAAGIEGVEDVVSKTGTSIASGHVVGIAASIRRKDAMADVQAVLKANAKLLGNHEGFPMLLTNTVEEGCGGIPPTLSPAPTLSPVACTEIALKVAVLTDEWPTETSWKLIDQCTNNIVASRDEYDNRSVLFEDEYCLPPSHYKFVIEDSYGSGICCDDGDGNYKVFVNEDLMFEGGNFGAQEVHEFGSCEAPSVAPSTTYAPSKSLTDAPSKSPTDAPSKSPTDAPSKSHTDEPSKSHTDAPSKSPTDAPTKAPSAEGDCCAGVDKCKKKPERCKCVHNKCKKEKKNCMTKGDGMELWGCNDGKSCVADDNEDGLPKKWGKCRRNQNVAPSSVRA